ncbi:DUF4381 domain-containing protein [Vibrio crassostreae]|uniref:DUF4381 domain-containing protein n=1 Tax=Vibrio crassostreae TaxID=246167 RepID=UPI001B300BC6|nr:DUF4381 domain-containing protein [Vibrio crassostreae]
MSESVKADYSGYILRELIELPQPEFTQWMPQTIGWKVLGIAAIGLVTYKAYGAYKFWKSNLYRREAIKAIEETTSLGNYEAAQRLSKILKVTSAYSLEFEDQSAFTTNNEKMCEKLNFSCVSHPFETELFLSWQQKILRPRSVANFDDNELKLIKASVATWVKKHSKEKVVK